MTHNGEDPPHPPISMLAVCSRTSSRAKCAFISQRLSPPKNPATLKFGMRGGSGLATSLGRMCVYFANTGYQFQPSFGAINGAAPETPPGPWLGPSPWPRTPPQRHKHPGPARPRMPRRRLPRGRFPRPRGGAQRRRLPRGRFPWPRGGVQPWPKG